MKNKTKELYLKLLIVPMFIFFTEVGFAQGRLFLEEVNGQPIKIKQYEEVTGSPYLQEEWKKGIVKVAKNKVYEGLEIKYDQVEDVLLFKDEHGEALRFVEPVEQFTIPYGSSEKIFRNGFPPANGSTKDSFYEVLTDGETTLLKRTNKIIREEKVYNSATKVKSIQPLVNYYIAKGKNLTRIKGNSASVLKPFEDKKVMLEEYIKANKLNLKDEQSLISLVDYYNSI